MDDEILVRVDVLIKELDRALPSTLNHPALLSGRDGAGGFEIGAVAIDARSAEQRQESFVMATNSLVSAAVPIAASEPQSHIRLSITFVPDLGSAGVIVSSSQIRGWAEAGVEIALDAQPSASWIEARFPTTPSSLVQGTTDS